jgi:hypothetical protein
MMYFWLTIIFRTPLNSGIINLKILRKSLMEWLM